MSDATIEKIVELENMKSENSDFIQNTESEKQPTLCGDDLFDSDFYIHTYPKVLTYPGDPYDHYLKYGKKEGLHPNIASKDYLDKIYYIEKYPDVLQSDLDYREHYIRYGKQHGYYANAVLEEGFDPIFYLATYPKVMAAALDPFDHYMRYGIFEGLKPHEEKNIATNDTLYISDHKTKVFIADWRLPHYDGSAGERATFYTIKTFIKLGYDVYFMPLFDYSYVEKYTEILKQELKITVVFPFGTENGGISWQKYLEKYAHSFKLFYIIRLEVLTPMLDIIRKNNSTAPIICQAPDARWLRELRQSVVTQDEKLRREAMQCKQRELAVMRKCDTVLVVSDDEVTLTQEADPSINVQLFRILYADVVSLDQVRNFADRHNIFFCGGGCHTPNTDACLWFANEIWPRVRRQLPDVTFHIFGADLPESVTDLKAVDGIQVDGYIANFANVLPHFRLSVAPIRFGAGIKGKVALSLGYGVPCVCTTMASEGMLLEDEKHVLVADTPEAFADAVVRAYTDADLWQRLSTIGLEHVRKYFSVQANDYELANILWENGVLPPQVRARLFQLLEPTEGQAIAENKVYPVPIVEGEPDVSIIIACYNNFELTRQCILSILHNCDTTVTYEIIVADDCSTDETVTIEKIFPGIVHVRTASNQGFLQNCNNAAVHARGKHILLLNNDTLVLPGWLQNLYAAMEADERVAIVGSKQLYIDGTINEAGGLIRRDGVCFNFARGMNFDAPCANYQREVDYITGASMLVRGSFWRQRSGFDTAYQLMYCEDSDLAMQARHEGYLVIYEPRSSIIHLESQTVTSSRNLFQKINTKIFFNKWHAQLLEDHCGSDVADHVCVANACRHISLAGKERRKKRQYNIIFFTPFPSHPPKAGNSATMATLCQIFYEKGHRVHAAIPSTNLITENNIAAMRSAFASLDVLENSNPLISTGKKIPFNSWFDERIGYSIFELCLKYDIDILICSYIFHTKMFEYVPRHILKIVDTHDRMSNRYEMLKKYYIPLEFFSCTRNEEASYLQNADIIIARTDSDREYFNDITKTNKAITISHPTAQKFVIKKYTTLKNIGFVASPNEINLKILLEFVYTMQQMLGLATKHFIFNIAGNIKEYFKKIDKNKQKIIAQPWIHMLGFVDDLQKFYVSQDVIIAPIIFGTGINVKTVEVLSYGVPLVMTENGSKGINATHPLHKLPNYPLNDFVYALFDLSRSPERLNELAEESRRLFTAYKKHVDEGLEQLFMHEKLFYKDITKISHKTLEK